MSDTSTATVTNLRDAKRAQASARRQAKATHPATASKAAAAKAPAKKAAPAKAAAKTPEKKARKAAVRSTKPSLRWKEVDGGGMVAAAEGVVYVIAKSGDKFAAKVERGDDTEVILDGISGGKAYSVLTRFYHYGELPAKKA